ncbi:uroporphyrinogen-III C-methyltransferase [Phaeobacter gallaeciensis]|uniref:uroporphyrinogen-III C-methyltransferase n=1 Tax=Phaeobacter gallaeciensis TaxID=60890 RepID=A0AAC9ZAG2_9RHOB|nr:uroporphyrinogen-III C-methyltransferase [Phaeobacter gallaeciensis]AHD10420.1 uroporphyrin-III C-methyltransferase [Phaeobacter gallaeciensis DSM 26640]ATE93683.1 uroporphyrin-III C-methyltransferase CobA [Phaeobacter gallaeciensis]ATE96496.1 uroporphyrin-III C-methyltransferase CobA [Phaeobacter gallaeciensis]ATF02347.1 uroporphyrin-III C-methyltransferase CobA [Phaeobacter gallaeciensis]ATF06727.1 uroporphyrin-III C-methyltransferase CobA [Phaeobacter gallaeciensis]
MSGFVSFVSSGPGDPELLTVKAVKRLEAADAVLFDDLSSGPILSHARADADLVGVGKRAGRPSPKQDHVSQLLVDYAQSGQHVVRLKSGDSGVFGRLEEEITALRQAGIGFEIVPGVTAASAAAAAANIPLTRRLTARRLQFITGHDVTGGLPDQLNLAALADPDATTVVYMGKRTFASLAEKLLDAGLPPQTHALIALGVSTPEQSLHCHTVGELPEVLRAMETTAPVLILYGPLADQPADPAHAGLDAPENS